MGIQDWLNIIMQEIGHLFRAAADIEGGFHMGQQLLPAQSKHGVFRQQINEIICKAKILYISPGLLGMDADALVELLPVPSPLHRVHHDVFAGHEGQLL